MQYAPDRHASNMESCCLYPIALTLFFILLLYKYLTRNHGYWKARGIPEAKGAVIGVGHVLDQVLLRKNMGMMTDVFYKAHPHDSMVGIYVAQTPVLVVRHPDLVKFVLSSGFTYFSDNITLDKKTDPLLFHDPFFQNGQGWKDARGVFVSAFSSKKLKDRIPAISATCEKLVNYLREKCGKTGSVELEIKDLFEKYTLDVGANSILSIDGHTFVDKVETHSLRSMMHSMFKITDSIGYAQNLIILLPALGKLLSTGFAPKWVNVGFKRMVEDIKSMRGSDKTARNDVLQHIADYLREKGLDSDELAAHAFSFIVEQYETSSSTLGLMAYFAAKYPKVQEKMREEVEEVLKKHGNICSYEAINDMTYIEQVAKESLRLFTPVGRMSRLCSKQVTLEGPDGLTCTLRPGDEVHIPVASLHMDPQYWENPEEFLPERFDKDCEEQRHKFVYLAFGEGPRMCPGMRMGLLQVKAGMAAILKNYVIERSERMNEPARLDPRYFLVSINGGIWVRLRSRT
ncbi:probable cytochrome P450 28d1 [Diachasma alloeum]|uniref:probable cytochrome P450 28d1 n=1 Tax=Diachasma alloeum TaxID=454923 RepID=UPI0007381973|nr:probable cytochrome P450 28d1 [Diachasma alloeum]